MQEYNGLLKRKNKALNIFEKTKNQLFAVCDEIHAKMEENKTRRDQSEQVIARENANILERKQADVFLNEELEKTRNTIEKIDAILQ